MADEHEKIEPETQHEEKQAATQDVPVEDQDVVADDEQETQHARKQAATQTGERRD